jgi:hypothetical protein
MKDWPQEGDRLTVSRELAHLIEAGVSGYFWIVTRQHLKA